MLLPCGLLLLLQAAPAPPPALASRLHELVDGFKGQVFLYAKNLETGASIGLREDERVRTASTIKLAVMVEAFDRVERGELRWDHPLTLTAASQVGGSGILGEFAPGLRLTLQDAMHLMIVISDNTATNLVILQRLPQQQRHQQPGRPAVGERRNGRHGRDRPPVALRRAGKPARGIRS
jgi:beta-lactamase class A